LSALADAAGNPRDWLIRKEREEALLSLTLTAAGLGVCFT
jgi:hypothetical protein